MIKCLSETSEIIIISTIISKQVTHSGHEHYVIMILNVFWILTIGQNSSRLPALDTFPSCRCNPWSDYAWIIQKIALCWVFQSHILKSNMSCTELEPVCYIYFWDTPEKYSFSEFIFLAYTFSAGQIENHRRNLNIICEWYPQIFSRNKRLNSE